MDRIVDFFFEAGMLKRTPRTGWQFLGAGGESVADHTCRAAFIALALARLDGGVNSDRLLRMVLVHDLPEARTGDLNYVNRKYLEADEARAARDTAHDLPFGDEICELIDEFRAAETPEAVLARDADQLEMLLSLREVEDTGATAAREWMPHVVGRLRSELARGLAERILERPSSAWWFDQSSDWWVRGSER